MLIRHQWLSPLLKPPTISEEEDEDEEQESTHEGDASNVVRGVHTADKEVAAWALQAMERRRLGKMGKSEKPALHAVSLDRVGSPEKEGVKSDGWVAAGSD